MVQRRDKWLYWVVMVMKWSFFQLKEKTAAKISSLTESWSSAAALCAKEMPTLVQLWTLSINVFWIYLFHFAYLSSPNLNGSMFPLSLHTLLLAPNILIFLKRNLAGHSMLSCGAHGSSISADPQCIWFMFTTIWQMLNWNHFHVCLAKKKSGLYILGNTKHFRNKGYTVQTNHCQSLKHVFQLF